MVRFAAWKLRFPVFKDIEEDIFELFRNDAIVEMGESEDRWAGGYHQAMSNLIAHHVAVHQSSNAGDHQPLQKGTQKTHTRQYGESKSGEKCKKLTIE